MNFFTQLRAAIRAGLFSKNPGDTNQHGDTEARAQAKETKESERIEKIEALLESVNSASQHVRNFYITFLLAGFYIAVIIWSTTDVMLLKDTPVNLPILNVELSITGFYTFAPFFFLLLHFNLLLQLCLLADKVHRFDGVVIELADQNLRRYYYTRLFAFAFTHTLSGRHHSGFLRFLLTLLVWITIIWLPLVVLVGLQVGFLAYHDETILLWQRIAVSLDVLILAVFWPIIRSIDGKWRSWFKQATGILWFLHRVQQWRNKSDGKWLNWIKQTIGLSWFLHHVQGWWNTIKEKWLIRLKYSTVLLWFLHRIRRLRNKTTDGKTAATQHKPSHQPVNFNSGRPMLEGGLSLITAFSVLLFSWGIAVLPDSKTEQAIGKLLPDSWLTDEPLSDKNPDGKRYFRLTEYFFDQRYDVDDQGESITKSGVFNRNLVLKEQLLVANELSAEDEWHIRHGDEKEREAALKKVRALILSGRNLQYADFSEAILPKVDFVGADDKTADLKYAKFGLALLNNARMGGVELKGADLSFAKLHDAFLIGAQLQGANLLSAELQGAYLWGANLQGADLFRAELQGADLREAELQGADLENAQLQGADLREAELQGADLTDANLMLADIFDVTFGRFTEKSVEYWMGNLAEAVKDEKLLKRIHARLSKRIDQPTRLEKTYGKKISANSQYGDAMHTQLFGFGNRLSISIDRSDYLNSLAMYQIELACANAWTAAGIFQHRLLSWLFEPKPLASETAQCLLSLTDQRNQSGELVCPALSEINDDTYALLKWIAADKQSADTIQATFECKTALFDPQTETEVPEVFGEAYR